MSAPNPTATVFVREQRGQPFYEAFWRYNGRQLKRRLGLAWLDQDATGEWVRRKGRIAERYLDERRAHVAAAKLVAAYVEQADKRSARNASGARRASPSANSPTRTSVGWHP